MPKQLAIIGGGVIATELASSMADLGVEVTMIEVNEDILLTEIEEVRELLKDHLKNQSIRILTGAKISKVTTSKVILDNHEDVSFDTLLVATGRQPNIKVAEDLDIDMMVNLYKSMNIIKQQLIMYMLLETLLRVINLHIQRVHMDYMLLKLWLD